MTVLVLLLSGFGIGLISGCIGVGGGTMFVPLFVYLYHMNMYKAVGTSLALIGPVALIGAFSHYLRGNVDPSPVLWIFAGTAAGMFLSGQIIHLIPETILRKGFSVFLVVVAFKLYFK